ncbi:hypothetical protein NSK_001321 [Nannochloropsis salina CCMP1776]|uniref:Uncharacterized protein n=1 Tax=Nannochloropsis salina CCMP1776 TaxID=1027361 RepID=A0A4D9D9C8_9STRA|nr:hypothetical protein NSK_001321 [Nannochloropsis salina CCMP1776]|eukprot:TFJ86987.1 hypothetical protein NSK_001321 [Nannochloropsis salina CCMP1776]
MRPTDRLKSSSISSAAPSPFSSASHSSTSPIVLVASDVDGTLLGSSHTISPRTIASIRALRKKGILFVPATGKSRGGVRNALGALGEELTSSMATGGVYLQGLMVYKGGDVIYERMLDPQVALDVMRFARDRNVSLIAFNGDRILCEKMDATIASVTQQHEPMPVVVSLEAFLLASCLSLGSASASSSSSTPSVKVPVTTSTSSPASTASSVQPPPPVAATAVYASSRTPHSPQAPAPSPSNSTESTSIHKLILLGPPPLMASLRPALESFLGPRASITKAQDDMLEVLPCGGSKGLGLRKLLEALDVPTSRILAIGDQENDLEMLKMAGTAVAMGNAPRHVKAVAGHSTRSNDEDGAARAFERFCLQELSDLI